MLRAERRQREQSRARRGSASRSLSSSLHFAFLRLPQANRDELTKRRTRAECQSLHQHVFTFIFFVVFPAFYKTKKSERFFPFFFPLPFSSPSRWTCDTPPKRRVRSRELYFNDENEGSIIFSLSRSSSSSSPGPARPRPSPARARRPWTARGGVRRRPWRGRARRPCSARGGVRSRFSPARAQRRPSTAPGRQRAWSARARERWRLWSFSVDLQKRGRERE